MDQNTLNSVSLSSSCPLRLGSNLITSDAGVLLLHFHPHQNLQISFLNGYKKESFNNKAINGLDDGATKAK